MYIMRETIMAYSEASTIDILRNDTPTHTDKKRKNMLLKSSMIFNSPGIYLVGGKKTLKARRIKQIPSEYGRNISGYLNRRKVVVGTRRMALNKRHV
jgi:argonaute-like protein implicated in RNA metabolism and viral defense